MVLFLQKGHNDDGCLSSSILFKYESMVLIGALFMSLGFVFMSVV